MDIIQKIVLITLILSWLKSFIIGSSFNFHLWFKHGKKYTAWYDKWSQQKFDPDSPDS